MKKIFAIILLLGHATSPLLAQTEQNVPPPATLQMPKNAGPKIGLKLGYNFPYIAGTKGDFSQESQKGFMVSAFFSPPSRGGLGYRSELVFSRQGFSFDASGKQQSVRQDYIFMPHLTTFTIARKVQLQAGGQIGYLLNASKTTEGEGSSNNDVTSYMNRLDFGACAGVEVYPFKGLLLGGRYNISMANPYKTAGAGSLPNTMPYPFPFNPADFKGKNAVVQFFVGYRF
ncbi:MAG: porin family protein [Flavisolibacter sp.]